LASNPDTRDSPAGWSPDPAGTIGTIGPAADVNDGWAALGRVAITAVTTTAPVRAASASRRVRRSSPGQRGIATRRRRRRDDPRRAGEPARAPLSVVTPANPLLSRLELELPDGRYLLVYSQLEPVSADA